MSLQDRPAYLHPLASRDRTARDYADDVGDALLLARRPQDMVLEVLARPGRDGDVAPVVRIRLNRVEWELTAWAVLDVAGRLMIADADRGRDLPCLRACTHHLQRAAGEAHRLTSPLSNGRLH